MENNKLKELAQEFFDKYMVFQEADDQLKALKVEALYKFLADNQWKIYADYDKMSHRQMVVYTLENRDFKVEEIPDDLIDSITERFGDILYDDSDNHFANCIRYAIDDYEEDLEEYKLEVDNGENV